LGRRGIPWLVAGLIGAIGLVALGGGAPPVSETLMVTSDAAVTSQPSPSPSPSPTVTPIPPPTLHPTPLPTIVIPMLTRTAPMTTTPGVRPEVWELPNRIIPEPFGVEIHFTRASQDEMDYIAGGGFKWVRMDMFWHTIETALGRYNFSAYDVLVEEMTRRSIRIVFILDYGNPLYDQGYPPTSPGGQAAFARFAAVAARRYRDAGVIWDIWNEPNLDHFWVPKANAHDYGNLALKTTAAIRAADPTAIIVAPALAGYEVPFWHTLGQMGLFNQIDAVTIHSYGVRTPEELTGPYLELRAIINTYSPNWKVPILSGEWGFASTINGYSEGQQAQLLTRQWLVNLMHDIDLNIWYTWRDDGTDPDDSEQNFGTVRNNYTAKPAYESAQTLSTILGGYRFLRRVSLENDDDYLLVFQSGDRVAFAMWTIADAHIVILPISVYGVSVVEMTGDEHVLESEGEGLAVPITQSPRYLLFRQDQAPAYLGGWRPLDTVNCLTRGTMASIPVVFDPAHGMPLHGELQVWAKGALRGSIPVNIGPMAEERVRILVNLEGLSGNVPAEVRLVLDNPVMEDLQTAAIWIQVAEADDTE
ncbi:MAG: glycoside hydrolase family 5 protein, partial [Anaerolineae bacterium]|nr:glycoside hydrolase family 5 protein [Anaerolineae bacterium]